MVHTAFNDHLKSQGIAVDHILERQKQIMFGFFRKYLPKTFTLGQTAAAEHMTALMANGFFANGMFAHADTLVIEMNASHAVEEIGQHAVAQQMLKQGAIANPYTPVSNLMQVRVEKRRVGEASVDSVRF